MADQQSPMAGKAVDSAQRMAGGVNESGKFGTMAGLSSDDRVIRVGLLGVGTVGSQTARLLVEQQEELAQRIGRPIMLSGIACLHPEAVQCALGGQDPFDHGHRESGDEQRHRGRIDRRTGARVRFSTEGA